VSVRHSGFNVSFSSWGNEDDLLGYDSVKECSAVAKVVV
jgi:hypothetical protein